METTLKPWLFQPTLSILFNVVTDSFLTQKLSYHGSQVEIESLDDEKLEERISYYVANKSIISVIVDNFFLRHCMKIHILYSFQHVWNWRIDVTRKMANVLSSKDVSIIKLLAHTTELLQPLDVSVFKSLKNHWADILLQWL